MPADGFGHPFGSGAGPTFLGAGDFFASLQPRLFLAIFHLFGSRARGPAEVGEAAMPSCSCLRSVFRISKDGPAGSASWNLLRFRPVAVPFGSTFVPLGLPAGSAPSGLPAGSASAKSRVSLRFSTHTKLPGRPRGAAEVGEDECLRKQLHSGEAKAKK